MERLTRRNEANTNYYYPLCFEKCQGLGGSGECDSCRLTDLICEKLGQYEDAEEQGLLLRLPCKVGDTVYIITQKQTVEPRTADMMFIGVLWELYGEEWFATKEEAEQKLESMQKGE